MAQGKILIVEDSEFFINVSTEFLNRSSFHEILVARSSAEALKIVKENRPDLVLLDYFLGDVNGDECCRAIKSDEATKDIPVIMVTSAGGKEDIDKCTEAGCDEYVTKPVDKMVLLAKMKRFLDIPIRVYRRAPICTPATYTVAGVEKEGTAFYVGEEGMYIRGEALEKGVKVKAVFDVTDIIKGVVVEGEVAWNTDERTHLPGGVCPGFGLHFTSIDDKSLSRIQEYIELGNYLI